MVGEACLPSNAYYPRTPDYTLCSGVHVCWSEHSDSSFVYGFMILDYGFGTMTATTSTCKGLDFISLTSQPGVLHISEPVLHMFEYAALLDTELVSLRHACLMLFGFLLKESLDFFVILVKPVLVFTSYSS